jgi:hypothetical protein
MNSAEENKFSSNFLFLIYPKFSRENLNCNDRDTVKDKEI